MTFLPQSGVKYTIPAVAKSRPISGSIWGSPSEDSRMPDRVCYGPRVGHRGENKRCLLPVLKQLADVNCVVTQRERCSKAQTNTRRLPRSGRYWIVLSELLGIRFSSFPTHNPNASAGYLTNCVSCSMSFSRQILTLCSPGFPCSSIPTPYVPNRVSRSSS